MNPSEVLRIVDAIHRDKKIDQEIVFQAIEAALVSAAKKNYGDDAEIVINIDRDDGSIHGVCDGRELDPEETVGRIGAQTAKQVIIQKIREAERDTLYQEYDDMLGQMVGGVVQRSDGGTTTVSLGNVEAILPRSEQIPGETHHPNERVRATVFDVRKQGSRVKVVLSRIRPHLVRRLFEQEIPEISEGVIEVKAMAREPGYRSKVAVSSSDQRIDCVGACVGVRGNRIKNIVDELSGERIDIVRWDDDMQVLIPNALQPAEVDEVILCKMMGRAIVLVREDQLSLAIGRRGQNVRLASKLCGWDIEIMTREELEDQIERAVTGFSELEGINDELAESLVGEGFLSYDDLSVIEPEDLMAMGDLTADVVDRVVEQADQRAEEAEQAAAAERKRQRDLERLERATAEADALEESVKENQSNADAATASTNKGASSSIEGSQQSDQQSSDQQSDGQSDVGSDEEVSQAEASGSASGGGSAVDEPGDSTVPLDSRASDDDARSSDIGKEEEEVDDDSSSEERSSEERTESGSTEDAPTRDDSATAEATADKQ